LPEVAGDAALLINPENSGEITAAMQAILVDGSLRSHLQQAGLARASQFSWAKTGQTTAGVLKQYL
jgi:glycosyltransferase involved in cell wall biosynthesis